MQIEIRHSPSFASATVLLAAGEQVKAEAGAMISKSPSVEIETSTQGGLMKGLRRSLGGESFFMNTFTAGPQGGEVSFAPELPGDIVTWTLAGQTVFLQSGAYLASAIGVEVDSKWGGAKTFFSGEGLIVLKVSGHGEVMVASYGAIDARELQAGEQITVDTGHVVAWSETVTYQVRKVGNWKSTFLSGEGLVVDLTGPGVVYTQSRSPQALVNWLIPKLPKSSN
ncbi:MAG TPA: TIGR00266 family protein [Actinomycetota bacterium]|nr:TIGR00266 family protein [Actinomycetota bacterium]